MSDDWAKRYRLYFEGWVADCLVGYCREQFHGRTKAIAEKAVRRHLKHEHPGQWAVRLDEIEGHVRRETE